MYCFTSNEIFFDSAAKKREFSGSKTYNDLELILTHHEIFLNE